MSTTEHPTTDPSTSEPTARAGGRKLLGAAAFSLALAGGGVAGAVLGTPSFSSAQDDTSTTTEADATPTEEDRPPGGRFGHVGEGLTAAADALGITEDELRTALQDGQSIAQVAEAEGVDVQVVIDALVANGTDRLEEAIAELPDRVAELVEREGLPRGPRGPGGPGGHRGGPESTDDATTDDAATDDAATDDATTDDGS